MPITLLDVGLIVVMLISGLLAMVRGFMREVLSITAWLLAAGATLYAYGKLVPAATAYFNSELIAKATVVGGVFLVTLVVVSIFTVRISDMVLDSRVGARADHRGGGLRLFRLAGSRQVATDLGDRREVEGFSCQYRRLAALYVSRLGSPISEVQSQ